MDVGETTAPSGLPTIRAPTGWLREAQRFSVRIRFETAPSLRQGIAIVLVLGLATAAAATLSGLLVGMPGPMNDGRHGNRSPSEPVPLHRLARGEAP